MPKIEFTVYGEPMAQKRHRHFSRGTFTQVYDPSSKDKVEFADIAASHLPDEPFDEPLILVIRSYFTRPKSHYRTGKMAGHLKESAPFYHFSKPDTDNVSKFVMDSLSNLVVDKMKRSFWKDDSRVSVLFSQKFYTENAPRTEIVISPLKDYSFSLSLHKIGE